MKSSDKPKPVLSPEVWGKTFENIAHHLEHTCPRYLGYYDSQMTDKQRELDYPTERKPYGRS